MKTPNLPVGTPVIKENGMMHDEWFNFFEQLTTQLQQKLSNEGYEIPQQSSANIAQLNNSKSLARIIYDMDGHVAKINLNGIFKIIQTS